jgi:hypothetical protein
MVTVGGAGSADMPLSYGEYIAIVVALTAGTLSMSIDTGSKEDASSRQAVATAMVRGFKRIAFLIILIIGIDLEFHLLYLIPSSC